MSETTVALKSVRDGRFFKKVFAGQSGFTTATYDRILQWFSDNWPKGAEWPGDIYRPPVSVAQTGAAE